MLPWTIEASDDSTTEALCTRTSIRSLSLCHRRMRVFLALQQLHTGPAKWQPMYLLWWKYTGGKETSFFPLLLLPENEKKCQYAQFYCIKNAKFFFTFSNIFWGSNVWIIRFLMVLREVSSATEGCIYLIKTTDILWNILTIYNNWFPFLYIITCNLFLWWQSKFSAAITPVFSVARSFRHCSNLLICCLRNIQFCSVAENCFLFLRKPWYFFQDALMNRIYCYFLSV